MASGGASESKSRPEDLTPIEFARGSFRDTVAGGLTDIIGSDGGPRFGGRRVAPILPIESARLADLDAFMSSALESGAGVSDLIGRTLSGEFLRPESNPFLRDTIRMAQESVLEAFDENEIQDRITFSRAGQRPQESSPFSRSRARATEELAESLGDISTQIAAENFSQERLLQQDAVRQAQNLFTTLLGGQLENIRAQALPRMIADTGIERGMQLFNARTDRLLAALATAAGLADPSIGNRQDSNSWNFGVLS